MTVYSGQGRERLITAVAATSDATGGITFRQGPCPLGFVWQGSVTVPGAPSGALFNSSVASTPWGQHAGSTNFGPVQLWGNETLIVVGVGLQKNTQYSMLFFGVAIPESIADPLPPVAPLSIVSVETATPLLVGQVLNAGAPNVTITPPSLTRRLSIVVNQSLGSGQLSVVGTTTGQIYYTVLLSGLNIPGPLFVAIEPSIDASYQIQFVLQSGTQLMIWVVATATNPLVEGNQGLPLNVVFGGSVSGVFPSTGNPTTNPFKSLASGIFAVGNNQQVIAAPGAGQSIYIQDIGISGGGPPPVAAAGDFHLAAGGAFSHLQTAAGQPTDHQAFPGGFELPANTALQVDVIANSIFVSVTYVVGASQ